MRCMYSLYGRNLLACRDSVLLAISFAMIYLSDFSLCTLRFDPGAPSALTWPLTHFVRSPPKMWGYGVHCAIFHVLVQRYFKVSTPLCKY